MLEMARLVTRQSYLLVAMAVLVVGGFGMMGLQLRAISADTKAIAAMLQEMRRER